MTVHPKLSLWLMPAPTARERFAGLIDRLATRLGTPRFEPHITLSGCAGTEAETQAHAIELAAHLAPIRVRLREIEYSNQYFRCLYARAEPSPELLAAHRQAAASCGIEPNADYLPHLSLVYGQLPVPEKEKLMDEIGRPFDDAFVADRLCLCASDGEPSTWRLLGRFALSGEC